MTTISQSNEIAYPEDSNTKPKVLDSGPDVDLLSILPNPSFETQPPLKVSNAHSDHVNSEVQHEIDEAMSSVDATERDVEVQVVEVAKSSELKSVTPAATSNTAETNSTSQPQNAQPTSYSATESTARNLYQDIPSEFWNREEFDYVPTGSSIVEEDSVDWYNGRTYHGYRDGKYWFPNDAPEQDRLDLQHASFTMLLKGKLSFAPLPRVPRNVLDVGTGTGIWALEFARQNLTSNVVGTDLSKIQPQRIVPNCEFIKADAEDEWVALLENDQKFDYIHLRFVVTCFDDPKKVMARAFDNLNPGGWIEYQEALMTPSSIDNNLEGTPIHRWCELIAAAASLKGRNVYAPPYYKDWLRETGFVDIVEERLIWPTTPWSDDPRLKRIGRFQLRATYDGLRGIGWKALEAAGLTSDEIEALTAACKAQLVDETYRPFLPVFMVYGRKPFEWEKVDPHDGAENAPKDEPM